MKKIRSTTSKTRKGVIAWLAKWNPAPQLAALYESDVIIAVHIHKYTGKIVYYESRNGILYLPGFENLLSKAA